MAAEVTRARQLRTRLPKTALILLFAVSFVLLSWPLSSGTWFGTGLIAWLLAGVVWLVWLAVRLFVKLFGKHQAAKRQRTDSWIVPGWRGITATGLALTMTAAYISIPETGIGGSLDHTIGPGEVILIVLMAIWLVRVVAATVVSRDRFRPNWRAWLAQPVLVLLLFVLALTNAPSWAVFLAGKSSMERTAKSILDGSVDPYSVHRVGLYSVSVSLYSSPDARLGGFNGGSTVCFVFNTWSNDQPELCYDPSSHGNWYGHWSANEIYTD